MNGVSRSALNAAKWIGTGAGVSGATLVALNLGVAGYGFVLFLPSSLLWTAVGLAARAELGRADPGPSS